MGGANFLRRSREGFSPISQVLQRLGRTGRRPKFAGVRLQAPDSRASWGIVRQVSDGEYNIPGLRPERGDVVIDIGANIGVYSLWAARRQASVTAYEPHPTTYECLKANTANRTITPIQAAVVGATPKNETVALYVHDAYSTRNTLVGREVESGGGLTRSIDVPVVGIDRVLAGRCDLLKIDAEGGEFDICGGASRASLRRARRILLEFHRVAGDPAILISIMEEAGFDAAILAGQDSRSSVGLIGAIRR